MALARLLATTEAVEMILENLDPQSLVAARRAHYRFRNAALGAPALRHKLLLSAHNSPSFVWRYFHRGHHGTHRRWTVQKPPTRWYNSPWDSYFTIKTPNPTVLRRTHEPEYYSELGRWNNINQPEWQTLLIALDAAHDRARSHTPWQERECWQDPEFRMICLPGIDRVDIRTRFFPAELDKDSIYRDMFLFYEYTPSVKVHYQLNNKRAGGEELWGVQQVMNPEGVRTRDVVNMLRWESQGMDTSGEWAVQISVDGAIFPSEMEMAMVDDGDEHEEWTARRNPARFETTMSRIRRRRNRSR